MTRLYAKIIYCCRNYFTSISSPKMVHVFIFKTNCRGSFTSMSSTKTSHVSILWTKCKDSFTTLYSKGQYACPFPKPKDNASKDFCVSYTKRIYFHMIMSIIYFLGSKLLGYQRCGHAFRYKFPIHFIHENYASTLKIPPNSLRLSSYKIVYS